MQSVKTLAAYLQAHPTVSRVITCDQKVGERWSIELYSDSDWAGCLETRRSTDSHLAIVAGAVVTCTTQTQPGLPAKLFFLTVFFKLKMVFFWGLPARHVHSQQNKKIGLINPKKGEGNTNCNKKCLTKQSACIFFSSGSRQ